MPSHRHEVLVATLREQPELLGVLVHALTGRDLPPGLEPIDSTVRFVDAAEVRPDLVLAHGSRWAMVEVQNQRDPEKRRRWPLAASLLLDQKGTLGDVIVITAQQSVATWARTVAHLSTPHGTRLELTPVVLHLSEETAHRLLSEEHPELALLATWAVASDEGAAAQRVVERAIELTAKLPDALQEAQQNAILSLLGENLIAWLKEKTMRLDEIPMSPAALELRDALRAIGAARAKREALLVVLGARGVALTEKDRALIERCEDQVTLDRWIANAATAAAMEDVLVAPKPKAKRAVARVSRASTRRATRR